jgi:DNA-binding GntR family transcriptional regulator
VNASVTARPPRRLGRREQLADEIAARLRADIMAGVLRPGTFIRLDDTAAQFGVSITPVREALRTLRSEGMVQLEPHRGHVVSPFTRTDVEDVFWLQSTIAIRLIRSAVERITETELDELEGHSDALATAIERRDADRIVDAEFGFFRTLNHASGRIKLAWFLLHAARCLPSLVYAADDEWGARAVAHQRRLVTALRRRDVEAAVQSTRALFTDSERRLTERLEELGIWS